MLRKSIFSYTSDSRRLPHPLPCAPMDVGGDVTIVVNHLTRMQRGYFCVAGLEVRTGRHVRPVLQGQRLPTALLARNGGPFDIGVVVDLGRVRPTPEPPEVEDHVFDASSVSAVRPETPDRFWQALRRAARPTFREIFGEELRGQRGAILRRRRWGRIRLIGMSLPCQSPHPVHPTARGQAGPSPDPSG